MILIASLASAASPRDRCLDGDEEACDRVRFEVATRWARGEVGTGPQEAWRAEELLLLVDPTPWRAARACRGDGDCAPSELLDCLRSDGPCLVEHEDPPRRRALPASAVTVVARSDTRVFLARSGLWSDPRGVDPAPPEVLDRVTSPWIVQTRSLGAGETVELSVPAGAAVVLYGDGDVDGEAPEALEQRRPHGCWSRVVTSAGEPVADATVFTSTQVGASGAEGLVRGCGDDDVAVSGDAMGRRHGGWELVLEPGTRPRCALDGHPTTWCDQLLLDLPEELRGHDLRWSGTLPDGAFRLTDQTAEEARSEAEPATWDLQRFAGMPAGYARSPYGLVCAIDGRWRFCPEPTRYRVVDERGEPTLVGFGSRVIPGLDGWLEAWPGFDPGSLPYVVEVRGPTIVVRGHPRTGERAPAQRWSAWRGRDADAMARAALAAAQVELDASAELRVFPGGAIVVRQGRPVGTLGFADTTTAVWLDRDGRRIVHLGEVTP